MKLSVLLVIACESKKVVLAKNTEFRLQNLVLLTYCNSLLCLSMNLGGSYGFFSGEGDGVAQSALVSL